MAVAAVQRAGGQGLDTSEWGGPVMDIHLHLRSSMNGNTDHMNGAGVAKAVLLAGVNAESHAKEVAAAHPDRFVRFASIDVTQPDAIERLRAAAENGAVGFGEIKSQVRAAGPEMQRLYALAAELGIPITIHFQEVTQPGSQVPSTRV